MLTFALLLTAALPAGAAGAQASPEDGHEHVYETVPGARKEPTRTEHGYERVRCKLCGYEEYHVLNVPGHKVGLETLA